MCAMPKTGLKIKINLAFLGKQRKTANQHRHKIMKMVRCTLCFCALACSQGFADTMIFSNGNSVSGIVAQTNSDVVLLLTENAAFNYSKSDLKEIKTEPARATAAVAGERLPNFQNTILLLSKQPWATNLTPIPAAVIDKGVLKTFLTVLFIVARITKSTCMATLNIRRELKLGCIESCWTTRMQKQTA